ncbi:hypothetical protein FACS1894211_09850 [Clostridia bacterium]|nr:hypothetical protein FACS1894211_09850 [Clostridia bacterium]
MNTSEQIKKRLSDTIRYSRHDKNGYRQESGNIRRELSQYTTTKKIPSIETFALLCDVLEASADEILGIHLK